MISNHFLADHPGSVIAKVCWPWIALCQGKTLPSPLLLDIRKLTVLLAHADATVLRTNRLPGRQILRAFVGRLHSYTTQTLPRQNAAFTTIPGKPIFAMEGLYTMLSRACMGFITIDPQAQPSGLA